LQALSTADQTAEIACTLPPTKAADRLCGLEDLLAGHLESVVRTPGRLRLTVARGSRPDIEERLTAWAAEEKACCAFLGFGLESDERSVTLEIVAPAGAEPTLDGIDWLVRAAGGKRLDG
jgi:hypothetical protein